MAVRSLNRFRAVRLALVAARKRWLAQRGVRVADSATVSLSSRFVTGGGDIVVGDESLVAFKTLLITRTLDGRTGAIRIGRRCFIGGGAVVLPGVTIGDEVIVAAGAVVAADVPAHSVAAGVPAAVLRSGLTVGRWGRLEGADDRSRALYR